ncbi:hypothetical protein T05_14212 [Trichinella murrelli]|uniref:Uncharacterized protein n=1 Tax=Trichinella murrelli TaxID=144512 RepID=A0A0V0U630_9BILA|nr:hypothetical protein T05_14212 [Trichinella murrelli]
MHVEETLQCRNFLIHGKEICFVHMRQLLTVENTNQITILVENFQFDNNKATLQAKLHVTVLLFVVAIPSDDGMKLKLTSFRSREKQVHAKCPSGALKSSNMYDNSTKQSLLLIGYFSGNAIELYRFGLNPSAGFFVSSFLISIIEVTIYL